MKRKQEQPKNSNKSSHNNEGATKKLKQSSLLSMFTSSNNSQSSLTSSDILPSPLIDIISENKVMGLNNTYELNKQYKFISWNVNGIYAVFRKEPNYLKMLVEKEAPTCLCLQETKLSEDVKLSEMSNYKFKGYIGHFNTSRSRKGYSGTACFVLKNGPKVLNVKFGIGKEKHDLEGRAITVEYEDFYLVNTYCPNSGQNLNRLDYRTKEWDVDLLKYFEKLEKKKPIIWGGDLNVAISEIDIHDPLSLEKSPGFTKEERLSTPLVTKTSPPFIDSFRFLYPEKKQYSYYGYINDMRSFRKGWRIDYFACTDPLKEKIVNSYILEEYYGSDHLPIGLIINKE